ncbi:hypothetical protein Skr01_57280 [Sphaerisporangium krabiense]|uniref:DnaJ-class molecular chaperone n=1 Tax=Sphaerisporangium krabiense TaxID=763782 RepID=A0A7W8Z8W3_9ACTN|nr:hypothetical protein [Sphaerisporangium krabiense]MBB5629505.1 DnaJ-class molecular chaperone [Sphaerisporangium krabiense]GII65643.1 hypothetical protein Skr01_57280 [Sphaerisporangium krabiense]
MIENDEDFDPFEDIEPRAYRCATCHGTGIDHDDACCRDCSGTGIDNHR